MTATDTRESHLLRAILADPEADLPREVLADWWDENGQPERAEFCRCQIELAKPCDPWCRNGLVQESIREYRAIADRM